MLGKVHIPGSMSFRRIPRVLPAPEPYEPLSEMQIYGLFAAHLLLGLLIRFLPVAATAHAFVTAFIAARVTFRKPSLERMMLLIMYLLACSILWRVGKAGVLWFFPEYLAAMVFFFGLWRLPTQRPGIGVIFLFFVPLLLSVPLTLFAKDVDYARGQIAYILIPLLLLTISIYTVSKFELNLILLRDMAVISVFPIVANWAISGYNVYIVGVEYGTSSHDIAAGGVAANQVSNAFSYAAVALMIAALIPGLVRRMRYLFFIVASVFFVQSIMTFSRGGVVNIIVFIVLTAPFFLQDKRQRIRFFVTFAVLLFVFTEYIIPDLDTFTEGALERRYEKEGTTGRENLIEQDIGTFLEYPLTGVGPGMARELRHYKQLQRLNAHTEYTRILAEHGAFGLFSLVVLMLVFLRIFRTATSPWQRGLIAGSIGWVLAMLGHSATRIPMFILLIILATGLAYAREQITTTAKERS